MGITVILSYYMTYLHETVYGCYQFQYGDVKYSSRHFDMTFLVLSLPHSLQFDDVTIVRYSTILLHIRMLMSSLERYGNTASVSRTAQATRGKHLTGHHGCQEICYNFLHTLRGQSYF